MENHEKRRTGVRKVGIEFLYLDLDVCTRCRGTDAGLEAALSEVSPVMKTTGVEVSVRKIRVESEEQARTLGFLSSPTIRINGRDIAPELRESRCDSCGACSCNGEIDCRVWVYRGREYTEAPKAMIVDAILREAYGGVTLPPPAARPVEVPENLRRFFSGKSEAAVPTPACCPPEELEACCPPSAKAACCETSQPESCGCR